MESIATDEGAIAFPGKKKSRLLKPNRSSHLPPPRVHKRGNPPIGIDFPRGILPRPAKNPITPNAGKCAARPCRARRPDNPTEHPALMRARASPDIRHPPHKKPCVPRAAYRNLNAYSFLLRLNLRPHCNPERRCSASRPRLDEAGCRRGQMPRRASRRGRSQA